MPDVWTGNPQKLRTMLVDSGIPCGVESRVLHPRDPEWTCHIDTPGARYDLYIHALAELHQSTYYLSFLVMVLGGGVLLGLFWGRFFWR